MIQHLVPLVSSFLAPGLLSGVFYPLFCIYFIMCTPAIIRALVSWR